MLENIQTSGNSLHIHYHFILDNKLDCNLLGAFVLLYCQWFMYCFWLFLKTVL